MNLTDPNLLRDQSYVNGEWLRSDSGAMLEVRNPADGNVIGTVPDLGAAETRRAVSAAEDAWPSWRRSTARERSLLLRRWFQLILDHQEDLARLMTAEQGKPLAESLGEVAYGASFVEWFADEARRVYGDTIPANNPAHRILVLKQPIGVVAAITPWNFPLAMITRKVAPALGAGCPVVVKPAEDTPLTALALAELAHRAGIPPGVFNVLTGRPGLIGGELTANPAVRKLSFTGSTEVGKLLMRECAGTLKKLSLELGGNAPFIVFDDADLERAVAGALASKYRNTGQTCVCANRILVQGGIYDAFAERLAEQVRALRIGDGMQPAVQQGPLINESAVRKVEGLIQDAVEKGARVVTGGHRHALGGTFFEPTVLCDVSPAMRVSQEEIFGPVAPLYRFSTEDDAVRLANETRYGLAAYFYTRDLARAWRVSEGLEYGIVGINEGVVSTEVAPFGGVKESGVGREGSKYGIDEFLETKYVCIGGVES